ncbi:unnamed protein product [Klebsiella pneumoniae subsp. rhinoscleromatis SB3432]|nr:unnamed protein product [Klebsiella pneumoniae subsp. rhinoscleromatis SB3432]
MSKIWSKEETLWSFALYGTAVGAGTLFLPIQLGSAGAIVLFITALVAWPLTYWPHKALSQFILSANIAPGTGITGAVNHYYGKKIGNLITGLYFLAFFVVVLIYADDPRAACAAESGGRAGPQPDLSHGTTGHHQGDGLSGLPAYRLFPVSLPLFNPRLASGASHQPDAVQPADAPPGLDLYSRDGFRF